MILPVDSALANPESAPNRPDGAVRRGNGVLSAVVGVFFIGHGLLGCALFVFGISDAAAWVVWVGVALAGVHVAVCIATSAYQLTDTVRPPSREKKRHLVLKWVTGALLVATVAAHVLGFRVLGESVNAPSMFGALVVVAVAAALAVHLCVGAKSLLKDLGIDRKYRAAVRAVACASAAVFAAVALLAAFGIVGA